VSFDFWLQLDGISGTAGPDKNAIPILSFSFGASNSARSGAGGSSGAGKVNLSDLSLMAVVGAASPRILLACENGALIKTGTFTAIPAGSAAPGSAPSLRLMLSGVEVTSIQFSGSTGGDLPMQSISLSSQQIRFAWNPGAGKPETTTGWDLTTNTAV
jgi:type VI secretion system secreted protein Hcp